MTGWKARIYDASRSQRVLWRFAIVSLLVGTGIGFLLSHLDASGPVALGESVLASAGLRALDDDDDEVEMPEAAAKVLVKLELELAGTSFQFSHLVRAIPTLAPYLKGEEHHERIAGIFRARFPENQASLAFDYLKGWNDPADGAIARIEAAVTASPQRYGRYILGRLEMKRGNYRAAYEQFRREAEAGEAHESRYMAVRALSRTDDFAALAQLAADPRFAPYFDASARLDTAIKQKDWNGILKWVPLSQFESYQEGVFLVSLVAGLAWTLFLLNLGEIPHLWSSRTALCVIGIIAGVVSTTVTIYLVVLQDDILKYHEGDNIYHAFAYFIAGVGLREEFSKLLLFALFLPVLRKRDNELEALLVASFVGLGFAVEENGGYYMLSEAASAPGRFLTANFFHVALTGANGLALFRACAGYRGGFGQFLFVFPLTVMVHGAYDALLDTREIENGSYIAMIAYAAFCQYYFTLLRPLRTNSRRTLSLTGSFVLGISILFATVIAFQMATLGAKAGATLIFAELLSSAVLLFIFFREVHEPLTP